MAVALHSSSSFCFGVSKIRCLDSNSSNHRQIEHHFALVLSPIFCCLALRFRFSTVVMCELFDSLLIWLILICISIKVLIISSEMQ